jgi:hypothetical protein
MRVLSHCPKCQLERRPGADGCARCGLLVTRWETFAAETPAHPVLDPLWSALVSRWNDDGAHQRFLDAAAIADALDLAAARYRQRYYADRDDARAQGGLERAVRLAQTLYEARARSERPPRAPLILKIAGTMCAGLVLIAAVWVLVATWFNHR